MVSAFRFSDWKLKTDWPHGTPTTHVASHRLAHMLVDILHARFGFSHPFGAQLDIVFLKEFKLFWGDIFNMQLHYCNGGSISQFIIPTKWWEMYLTIIANQEDWLYGLRFTQKKYTLKEALSLPYYLKNNSGPTLHHLQQIAPYTICKFAWCWQ